MIPHIVIPIGLRAFLNCIYLLEVLFLCFLYALTFYDLRWHIPSARQCKFNTMLSKCKSWRSMQCSNL